MTTNFSGPFVYDNWSINPDTGFITPNPTPPSIVTTVTLISSDAAVGQKYTQMSISIPFNTTISFNWNYSTLDDLPEFDPFGYYIGATFYQLTNNSGPNSQSGSQIVNLLAGETFIFSTNSDGTNGPATTIISLFNFTSPGPAAPCFSMKSVMTKILPHDACIVSKNMINNKWIKINDLLLTSDHLVKYNGELLTAEKVSNDIVYDEDEVVDIITLDGGFISFDYNNISFATNKA